MRFAADENFDGRILNGLLARLPELDIVRVQDTVMYQAPDPALLEWLAEENRILLTHDVKTMPHFVYERIRLALPVPGIVEVRRSKTIGQLIDELEIIIEAGKLEDFENLVQYVPVP
jgi:hypothetical protein